MAKLSVIINAQNVKDDLPKAIESVKSLADEVVVIDQKSTDGTSLVARKTGAKVFSHPSVNYVELVRNFAISKAVHDWILILDPDEEIPQTLAKKIKEIIKKPEADYFRIPRKNIIFGKWIKHTLWWPDFQIRLFKKDKVTWNEAIHSVPTTVGRGLDLEASENLAIVHYNYDSVEEYLEKLNRYTSAQSELLIKGGGKFIWTDLIDKPFKEFISRYFRGEGYKDGLHGLALSALQAFSEFIVFLKIWQKEKFKESEPGLRNVVSEIRAKESDLHYWESDSLYKEGGKLTDMIRRKLKI